MKEPKRIAALLLAAALLLPVLPAGALAAEKQTAGSLCEHHPEHTAACGYKEAVPGTPCLHTHTEACYQLTAACVHVHTQACYPAEAAEEGMAEAADVGAGEEGPQNESDEEKESASGSKEDEAGGAEDGSSTEEDGGSTEAGGSESGGSTETGDSEDGNSAEDTDHPQPSACTHQCSEESGCIIRILSCPHERGEHTEDCGYTEEIPSNPCSFVCEFCKEQNSEGSMAEWPEAPKLPEGAPLFSDGQRLDGIYGQPASPINEGELTKLRTLSLKAPVQENPDLEIEVEDEIGAIIFIYVNGEAYKGGDLTVMEGDNFSYKVYWSPKNQPSDIITWEEGSWFEIEAFQVPGLNLTSVSNVSLSINGIKVGEYFLTYDKESGKMTYKVVFNRYIQFFSADGVMAYVQGSGRFSGSLTDKPIVNGNDSGSITVDPRPDVPDVPGGTGGIGWKPTEAPDFKDDGYPFGKGVKWNSSNDANATANEIEWRVVFLEQFQKVQREFLAALENGREWEPYESEGYILIEDTLDINQRFYIPQKGNDKDKYGGAPFYLEVPVMVPGTDMILNSTAGVGNANYDGPGEIYSLIKGNEFTKVPGEQAVTAEEINKVREQVENSPLTWTVITHPDTMQQTLLINAGKMGTSDQVQGVTWERINNPDKWPESGLETKIEDCSNKITALQNGYDSPIALMEKRATAMLNLLDRAVSLPANEAEKAEWEKKRDEWHKDYVDWRTDPRVSYLEPLAKNEGDEENEKWVLIRPLPNIELIEKLENCVAKSNGTLLKETAEYKDYMKSLTNLQSDQRIYLKNRSEYGKDWQDAREKYERALKFYEHKGIYGFVVKVRTESINTSMDTYSNSVNIELTDKSWSANDNASAEFSGGIIGSYNLGDVVFQKADAFYDTGNTVPDMEQAGKDKAGLTGAEFQMYCGTQEPVPPNPSDQNLAHFLDKDASINGKTYTYTHTGNDHAGAFRGDIDTLVTDSEGKIAISRIVPGHYHWLKETKAPDGYYLNPELIQITYKNGAVNYQLLPNVSRSVKLEKADAFSKNPVEGAEFTLYKQDGMTEIKGFSKKSLNDHETYWYDGKGTETLKTNEEGRLCIHGLAPGSYVLQETKAAPGYILNAPAQTYSFILENELPENKDDAYDEAYHYLLTKQDAPLTNLPGTAELTLTKKDVAQTPLGNAGFALFRFEGTEAQWKENPDKEAMWEAVSFKDAGGKYFNTSNSIIDVKLTGTGQWNNKTVQAVVTENAGEAKGRFSITDIPVGHYSISEVQVPDSTFQRDYRSFYFTVNGGSVGKPLQLYTDPEETKKLTDNTLVNYQKQAQLALVKYDKNKPKPEAEGQSLGDGWQYTENVLKPGSSNKGIEGAGFKLFMRRGGSTAGQVNPDPAELNSPELQTPRPQLGYDTCLAVGSTDKNGVLKLSDMTTRNNGTMEGKGLNPGEYYMIEVEAPKDYLLDQRPVHFSLDEKVFGQDGDPGLVMMSDNTKINYGLRLTKVDKETVGEGKTPITLAGAEFEVKVKGSGESLYFTGSAGVYQKAEQTNPDANAAVVTGSDGKLTLTGLEGGVTYSLTETKPPRGYSKLTSPIEMTTPVSRQDGELENDILFPNQERQIANERLKGKVSLHKQEAETGKPLSGAEFTLYETIVEVIPPSDPEYDPGKPNATRSHDEVRRVGTTDAQGNLIFDDLPWSQYYYIMETAAPSGYLTDQTKWIFSVDENSFDADGVVIPVQFPAMINSKGTLGKAVLVKTDAVDHTKKLEDAHFYLEKFLGMDANGEEIWVGYGQGMYITDVKGEIHFLLPPGSYKLSEMKAPDGYVLAGMKELFFTIEEPADGSSPPLVIIDEENSKDGVVTNQQGETGVYLKKADFESGVPLAGVTFRIYCEYTLFGKSVIEKDLYFIKEGEGNYIYTTDSQAPGATKDLVTNQNGEIYADLPKEFLQKETWPGWPQTDSDHPPLAELRYEETDAPSGVEPPYVSGPFGKLKPNIYNPPLDGEVVWNMLSGGVTGNFSITIQKTDGDSRLGLPGAEFELFRYQGADHSQIKVLGTGVTDENGYLVFDRQNVSEEPKIGNTYYLRETKAPEGYVTDQTIHKITLDENHLDENLHLKPITISLPNYQAKGSVRLIKTEKGNTGKGLEGAEFELLRKTEDADPLDEQWEHYGSDRYITDENGELFIENLPYGSYQLIERAAPLGYLLEDPAPAFSFSVERDGETIELGFVENEIDPNPARDVQVRKVAGEDHSKGLPGAEFELYERKADGTYHLRQRKTYITDDKGSFVIGRLPVGSYGLKEIKAPAGYELPKENMTYFAVGRDDKTVQVQIENFKPGDGPGAQADPDSPSGERAPEEEENRRSDREQWNNAQASVSPAAPAKIGELTDHAPGTGDPSRLMLWLLLMCISGAGFCLIWRKIRIGGKQEKDEKYQARKKKRIKKHKAHKERKSHEKQKNFCKD